MDLAIGIYVLGFIILGMYFAMKHFLINKK